MPPAQRSNLRHKLQDSAIALFAAVLLVYPVDWAIWRIRVATGGGMGTAVVTSTTAATLKGNRCEVYSQNITSVTCSQSLLPQSGAGACWWLRRHSQSVTQY